MEEALTSKPAPSPAAKRPRRPAKSVNLRRVAETDAAKRRRLADMLRTINAGIDALNANAETLRRRLA